MTVNRYATKRVSGTNIEILLVELSSKKALYVAYSYKEWAKDYMEKHFPAAKKVSWKGLTYWRGYQDEKRSVITMDELHQLVDKEMQSHD